MKRSLIISAVVLTFIIAGVWSIWPAHLVKEVKRTAVANIGVEPPSINLTSQVSHLAEVPELEKTRQTEEIAAGHPQDSTLLYAGFEGALPNVIKVSETHWVLDFKNQLGAFFLFRLVGIANRTVRIDCKNVPLEKWSTLNPVFSEHDNALQLVVPEANENNIDSINTVIAHNGSSLPNVETLWNFIPEVWASTASQISFVQKFTQNEVLVAIRPPFSLDHLNAITTEVKGNPACEVISIGTSDEGRPLTIFKVETPASQNESPKPCIVIYAREHADEPDSSWVVAGALRWILSAAPDAITFRSHFKFYIIPIEDPDGVAHGMHQNVIDSFISSGCTPESLAYANYFRKELPSSNGLALVLNFHNVVSREGAHLTPPLMPLQVDDLDIAKSVHEQVMSTLQDTGFLVTANAWRNGGSPQRLGGWLTQIFGGVHLPYEVNCQQPDRHITSGELQLLGSRILIGLKTYFDSDLGKSLLVRAKSSQSDYLARWRSYGTSDETFKSTEIDPFIVEKKCLDNFVIKNRLQNASPK